MAKVGAANVLSVADAKAFIEQEKPFIIDVKDSSDKDAIKNDKTYSVPLSNLVFMADPVRCSPPHLAFALACLRPLHSSGLTSGHVRTAGPRATGAASGH